MHSVASPYQHLSVCRTLLTCLFILSLSLFFRCKAYNATQLIIFMAEIFDSYMKKRLVDVALGRRRVKSLSTATLPLEMVTFQGNGKYRVQSQSTPSLQYDVDLVTGFCECTAGENGSLCKHQAACADYSMTVLPQVFTATTENRRWLASVAVGDEKVPPEGFFRGLLEPTLEKEETACASPVQESQESTEIQLMPPEVNVENQDENPHQSPDVGEFVATFQNVVEKYANSDTAAALSTAVRRLKTVKSGNQLNSILQTFGSGLCNKGAGRGKIRCQPTSIARRGPGKPRGAAPLGKGRRPSHLPNPKPKRPRNLSQNIAQNVANAKSHGSGH